MKKKTVAKLAVGAAAGVGAFCALTYYEVIGRNAKLISAIGTANDKKALKASGLTEPVIDERELWFNQQEFEEHSLVNADGNTLKGYLLRADEPSDIFVFCSHGYRCYGKREFRLLTRFYHDKGINVFIVDHQAAGESEGSRIGFGYFEYRDSLAWLNYMTDTFGCDIQIFLHGVSMGSATVMMMTGAPELPENVKFTVADCGYTSAWEEFEHALDLAHVPYFPVLYGANAVCRKVAKYDFRDADAISAVEHAKIPMLFIHGMADNFVPTYMCGELYDACSSKDKDILLVPGAEHAQSYPTDSAAYEEKVTEFIDKYLSFPNKEK